MTTDIRNRMVSRQLAKTLFPLASAIVLAVAIVMPSLYYYLEASQAQHEATVYAGILAENVRKLAADAPQLWKYQTTKYSQMINDFIPHKGILKITLTDERGRELDQYNEEFRVRQDWTDFPITGDPAPVVFNNQQIGTATVSISGRRIVMLGIIVLAVCALIGIALALMVYRLPLRAVRSLEREIAVYQRTLEEKVESRTRELHETTLKALSLADRAHAASQAKSEFLANMSHELRTPLNHIIGFTELIVDKQFGPLNAQQEEFLGDVLKSSRHLLALINDILDLSKVEAGKMELTFSSISLPSLMDSSLAMVREKALKHRIGITVDCADVPGTFRGDERKMKQILYNLLANAVKFTPEGGAIRISVAPAGNGTAGSGLQFTVSDTGIGLKAKDLERIFLPFEQADSSASRKYQGTGLGLSLTKSLVELHGGTIWAESDGEGKGSQFHFTLPGQESGQT